MAYTWDDAKTDGRRRTQYFEMFGNRAVYHDGWVPACRYGKLPWTTSGSASFDSDTWELYNIAEDFSEFKDLSAKERVKLRELQDLFVAEAAKYNVLPMDDRFAERADVNTKPNNLRGLTRFVYLPGTVRIPETSSPNTKNVDHTIAAEVEFKEGDEGVLVCCGGESGGCTLYVKDGRLHWEHNWFNSERFNVSSKDKLPAGKQILSAEIKVTKENVPGVGGKVTGKKTIGEGKFEKQVPFRFTVQEGFDVGCDLVTPVSDKYESPYRFTGDLKRVMVDISDATSTNLPKRSSMPLQRWRWARSKRCKSQTWKLIMRSRGSEVRTFATETSQSMSLPSSADWFIKQRSIGLQLLFRTAGRDAQDRFGAHD